MLKPRLEAHHVNGVLVTEFWDCLRLDPAPIQDLRKEYDAHLRAKGRPELVIDLLGVSFAGSSALSHFITLQKHVRQTGGRLRFCNVDPSVREAFRVSKLEPMFVFETDRAAALAAAERPPERPGTNGSAGPAPPAGTPPRDSATKSPGGTLLRGSRRRKLS